MPADFFEERNAILIERMIQAIESGTIHSRTVDDGKVSSWRVPDAGRLTVAGVILRLTLSRVVRARRCWIPGRNHKEGPRWEAFQLHPDWLTNFGNEYRKQLLADFSALETEARIPPAARGNVA